MLKPLGFLNRIKILNVLGNLINPSTEETSKEIVEAIGQESGSTVLTKLQDIWDKLHSLFVDGFGKVLIHDGEHLASVTPEGRLQVSTLFVAPEDTTPVAVTEYSVMTGTVDTVYVIPIGEEVFLQSFSAGAEVDGVSGNVVEIWYDPTGDGINMEILDTIFCSGTSDQHGLNSHYIGDGTNSIRMRRRRLGGGAKELFGRWEGYLQ